MNKFEVLRREYCDTPSEQEELEEDTNWETVWEDQRTFEDCDNE